MLRQVKTATFARRLTLLGPRHELWVGGPEPAGVWRRSAFRRLLESQRAGPVPVSDGSGGRVYWMFEDRCYWEDEGLEHGDVLALVRDRERRRRRRLERAHASLAAEANGDRRREAIPREVRLAVFQRDSGRCVQCGSAFEIQYDHLIPVSAGGASTVENLQIMCADCNREKGAALG
jgi:5-methylcytosine-specific restriction endonuclease McrA